MCNLSQGVLEQGIEQGSTNRLIELVSRLVKTTGSFRAAAEMLELSEKDIEICSQHFDIDSMQVEESDADDMKAEYDFSKGRRNPYVDLLKKQSTTESTAETEQQEQAADS